MHHATVYIYKHNALQLPDCSPAHLSWDSSVGTVTGYKIGGWDSILIRGRNSSLHHLIHMDSHSLPFNM